jgi:AAA15 family ATPase/GTPase
LVGRNNTGKSALLESFALACTAESGWYDARDTDLIETIVKRRGGWEYADTMIRIGEQEALIQIKGNNNIVGNMRITNSIENLSERLRENFAAFISEYVDSTIRKSIEITTRRRELSIIAQRNLERRIESIASRLKSNLLRQAEAFISYIDEVNKKLQFATLVGEKIEQIMEQLMMELGEPFRYFIPTEIIRSPYKAESKVVFVLSPSRQYLADVLESLTKSGDLINLIDILRERIDYFTDIRGVDKNFLVFLKGLKKPVPIDSMGDGFRAKVTLMAATMMVKGGVILMEEPEIRLHPGFMGPIVDQIIKTAVNKEAQYVISTHSFDFLKLLLDSNAKLLKVIRMYRIPDVAKIDYEVIEGEEALERAKDLQEDLRGV